MTRILKLIFVLTLAIGMTGCSDYIELNKISFVSGLGIDWTDDSKFKVTLQVINPSELATGQAGGGNSSPVILYTSQGNTISEAIREASKEITKNKDFTHVALTVIGENAAKHGIEVIIDSILREPRVSAFMSVLVAKASTAEEILNTMTPINKVSSTELVSKLKSMQFSLSEGVNPNIYQLGEDLSYAGKEIAISGVKIMNNSKEKNTLINLQTSQPTKTVIDEVAVFKGSKLIGWMAGRNVRGILMVTNKFKQTNLSIPCGKNKYTSLRLINQKIKTDVKVDGTVPEIKINNIFLAFLDETGCNLHLEKVQELIKLEKSAAKEVEKQIESSIRSAQKYKSDVFGFGDVVHLNRPKRWKEIEKDWAEEFSKAKIKVKTTVIIKRSGFIENPVTLEKN